MNDRNNKLSSIETLSRPRTTVDMDGPEQAVQDIQRAVFGLQAKLR